MKFRRMKFKESDVAPSIWETFSTDYPIPLDLEKHIHGVGHEHTSSGDACPTYIVPDMSIYICFHDQTTWAECYDRDEFHPIVLMFHEDGEMCDTRLSETHHHTWEEVLAYLRYLLKSGYTAPSDEKGIWSAYPTACPLPADLTDRIDDATYGNDGSPSYEFYDADTHCVRVWLHDHATWRDCYGTEDTRGPLFQIDVYDDKEDVEPEMQYNFSTWAKTLDKIRQLLTKV